MENLKTYRGKLSKLFSCDLFSTASIWWGRRRRTFPVHNGAQCFLPKITVQRSCLHLQGGERKFYESLNSFWQSLWIAGFAWLWHSTELFWSASSVRQCWAVLSLGVTGKCWALPAVPACFMERTNVRISSCQVQSRIYKQDAGVKSLLPLCLSTHGSTASIVQGEISQLGWRSSSQSSAHNA